MSKYTDDIASLQSVIDANGAPWAAIDAESAARMRAQNKFKTGLEIAQYTADIMRRDMAEFDADKTKYTQSLGCWHGFVGQQKLISIKKHFNSTDRRYLYLSGWMVAALRSEFGPLPDQSMHEKTSVAALIEELYTFLRQADARELGGLFRALDDAREAGDDAKAAEIQDQIDNHQTHIVPIIADIDAEAIEEEKRLICPNCESDDTRFEPAQGIKKVFLILAILLTGGLALLMRPAYKHCNACGARWG